MLQDILQVKGFMTRCYSRIRPLLSAIKWNILVFCARMGHLHRIRRLGNKVRNGTPLRVMFIDSEIAKWKCQSLYEAMKNDAHYTPIIGISRRDADVNKDANAIRAGMNKAREYFESLGNECVDIYNPELKSGVDLKNFSPDIVFYQQSWYEENFQTTRLVCKYALVCYVPYFTPNYGFPDIEAHMFFHRFLAFYFLLNKGWIDFYKRGISRLFYSGKFVPTGLPMFDLLPKTTKKDNPYKTVIYAPHFSVPGVGAILNLSTFLENGKRILAYAQKHKWCNWIFKPHPVLLTTLLNSKIWSFDEVKSYWDDWRILGGVCESSDYMKLFVDADVIITDCGSFLPEFGATGKPVIHLISSRNTYVPAPPSRELFSSYYEVHNLEEMYSCFKTVIEEGKDPLREKRLAAVKKANLTGQNAAKNIIDFFDKEFRIKR